VTDGLGRIDGRLEALEADLADQILDRIRRELASASEEDLLVFADLSRRVREAVESGGLPDDGLEAEVTAWWASHGITGEDLIVAFGLSSREPQEQQQRGRDVWQDVPLERRRRIRAATHNDGARINTSRRTSGLDIRPEQAEAPPPPRPAPTPSSA